MPDRLPPLPLPDLTGRRALVTGGSTGLGLATGRALAGAGADVTVTSRSLARAQDAAASLGGSAAVLETASAASVDALVAAWGGRPLDLLVLNAGANAGRRRDVTADGQERTLATNALGHVRLTHGLLEPLRAASGRVVTLGSLMAYQADADASDPGLERRWTPARAYARSKLACILLALELPARAGVAATCAHPGWATPPSSGRTPWCASATSSGTGPGSRSRQPTAPSPSWRPRPSR